MDKNKLHATIGIMAYNEEANIGRLLDALLLQELNRVVIDELVIVASGCTDRTEEIVQKFSARDARIRLLHQDKREGKASAVNLFLRSVNADICILQSADTIPVPGAIEAMVTPFADPKVGMVGGHPVPTNLKDNFLGYGVHMLWELHHQISLRTPKLGELIAFRNFFRQIPHDSAVDEASIELLISGQGLILKYAAEAVVYNKGPETVEDFLKQRRRIFAGHLYVRDSLGYKVSTMNGKRIFWLFLTHFKKDWRFFTWGLSIAALEMYARLLATYDYVFFKRKPYTWAIAESTKELAQIEPVNSVH